VDIYFARNQINERLSELRETLPPGAQPQMGAISTGLGEVAMWVVKYAPASKKAKNSDVGWQDDGSYLTPDGERLTTDVAKQAWLRTVQDWMIKPQIKGLPGVAGVDSIGGHEKQYVVQPDLIKLRALGLSLQDVVAALEKSNKSRGGGFIEQQGEAWVVRADGRFRSVEDIRSAVVASRGSTPIHLYDVATVDIGEELRSGSASEDGQEVVVGTALMRIGENSRSVAQGVTKKLEEVKASLPADVELQLVLDRSKLVNATIKTVVSNLAEGALLVIAVLFFLLGNIRAALITAMVIPVTILLMSTGMVKAGISGNLMSLGALDFGLIVDGAVIIVENCLRRLALKQEQLDRLPTLNERLSEVMLATKEMIRPSVFGQAIIMVVYIPVLALEGVEGKMFHPMALTVIMALASAFVLSLTLIPALIALFFKNGVKEKENHVLEKVNTWYQPLLVTAIKRPKVMIVSAVVIFCLSLLGSLKLGQEFIPSLDEHDIAMHVMRIPSTGIKQSTKMQLQVEKELVKMPEVNFAFSKTGTAEMAADPMPPSVSDTFIMLKPRKEWPNPKLSKNELLENIEKKLAVLPGNNYEFTQPIQMRFNELISGVRSDVAVNVFGDDFPKMLKTANKIATTLRSVPGASEVKVEQVEGQSLLDISLNRDLLARYGLALADVQDAIAGATGGMSAGNLYEGDKRFSITVRLADDIRNNPDLLKTLPLMLSDGRGVITLGDVADISLKKGLNQVSRENGKRRVIVEANVRGRDIASFVQESQQKIAENVALPAGYWLSWGGQFESLQDAKLRLMIVVPSCLFLVFGLLFMALGSVRQSLLVFSAIPLALSGGILALLLRGMPFSITAAVGFIALSGVAVLNGLVMVSCINQLYREGMPFERAIQEGALSRLRPVLMTALVAALGFVPMALATGTGAEVQRPLATVVIGGIISSTLLTLVVLPALYRRFGREKLWSSNDYSTGSTGE
jgi:cobalt-zinc-cadmium resistance protein CzcA